MSTPLWQPTTEQQQETAIAKFATHLSQQTGDASLKDDYFALHRYSVDRQGEFWQAFAEYSQIIGTCLDQEPFQPENACVYFPHARLNLAENLLWRNDDAEAITFFAEDQHEERLSWRELRVRVSQMQQALQEAGLNVGDRVAGIVPNGIAAIVGMLATTSLGGVWSSCSPDFGARGIVERFAQITPKFLICSDGYWYNGKPFDIVEKIRQVTADIPSLKHVIIEPLLATSAWQTLPKVCSWQNFTARYKGRSPHFQRLAFNHPAFILYSSGTTGKPKCFIHSAGAYLLGIRLDMMLHNDIRCNDATFFFTTCGWMMWNWLVGALGLGSRVVLYDGSPLAQGPETLFALAEREKLTFVGLSPKLLSLAEKAGAKPKNIGEFSALRRIASTGSPLSRNNFRYVYQSVKADVHLAPISGGTDILGCFLGGEPRLPTYEGEMQVPLLGKDVQVMGDDGRIATEGIGELVCRVPFLGQPNGFWDDPDGARYKDAYFTRFSGYWHHGDFLERTKTGYIIHGRSDTVLNPGGVRIGTAEIYQAIELLPEIQDSVVVAQQWQDDVRIVLFVVLAEKTVLDDVLCKRVRECLKTQCSPRHVPAKIAAVTEIPRTRSGKISEKAVCDVIHGREVGNIQALANPDCLQQFAARPEISQE